jgi:hypothetical protein
MCALVLVGSLWLNPCNVAYLYSKDDGFCGVHFTTRYERWVYVKMTCEQVAKAINE